MDLYSRTLFSGNYCTAQTDKFSFELKQLKDKLEEADAILIGAGAGLSTAAGLTYSGKRFKKKLCGFQKYFPHYGYVFGRLLFFSRSRNLLGMVE